MEIIIVSQGNFVSVNGVPYWRSQPPFDIEQYPFAIGVLAYRLHQKFVIDVIEEPLDVHVQYTQSLRQHRRRATPSASHADLCGR